LKNPHTAYLTSSKLNVWTALLTLELKFGTDASLQDTVDRACQHNNPKQGEQSWLTKILIGLSELL
jgi:hypothetical protein